MSEDDDTEVPDLDVADYRIEGDDVLERQDPPTLNEWKAKDLENSPIAAMNRIVMGGPLEDFDRFVLTSRLSPETETDEDPDSDFKTEIEPVLWSLLLKEARNLPSDEKLEFHLKGNPEIARLAGFDSRDDVPRNSTFWRAYADTDANEPRFDEDVMNTLRQEALKIVYHAKYVGFELPEPAEEHLTSFGKPDFMEDAEEITQRLLRKTLPHIAFDRDTSRTTYSMPSFAGFLAHLALEDVCPENGSETFRHMDIYEEGGSGADNFYYWVKQRDADEWFDRFLRANSELLSEAREMGHFQHASEVGLDTTGVKWFGDKSNNFVDGTKPGRNYAYAFHFSTIGIVGDEASLSLASHHLQNRSSQGAIVRALLQRVKGLHYFSDDQLDIEIERAYLDKGFYGRMHIEALRSTDTDFLIQAKKVKPVKEVIDKLEKWNVEWGIMEDYSIGDLAPRTNIILQHSEKRAPRYRENTDEEERKYGRWIGLVTDLEPTEGNRRELAMAFRKRWGVETQYRQFKHDFYAPTKSPKGRVRAFHFNFAQLFYNIWVLANLEIRDRYDLRKRRPLTADDVLHTIRDRTFETDDLPE